MTKRYVSIFLIYPTDTIITQQRYPYGIHRKIKPGSRKTEEVLIVSHESSRMHVTVLPIIIAT
jgi:hypothetical protein